MSGFSIGWLDLREDADRRARDLALLERARRWLAAAPPHQHPLVVDLGAGTGATLRALGTADLALHWRLVDHDASLLAEARRRHGNAHLLETRCTDISRADKLPLEGARLVTASALFDLVSADFIEAVADLLRERSRSEPVALYCALNYDGATLWEPAHPLDGMVLDAFNQDQRRDKGFGPALGPDAALVTERVFKMAGFRVYRASSPWVLDGHDSSLVSELIDGIAAAVAGSAVLDADALAEWREFRKSCASTGTCRVGHVDLLALPAGTEG